MTTAYEIRSVEPLGDFRVLLRFADGLVAEVDLADAITDAGPMFEPLRDPAFFALVSVDEELGRIVWPNGADLAPEVLHHVAGATA